MTQQLNYVHQVCEIDSLYMFLFVRPTKYCELDYQTY